jgi:hypothetical protein
MLSLAAAGLGRAIVPVSVLAVHKHLKVIAEDLTIDGQTTGPSGARHDSPGIHRPAER